MNPTSASAAVVSSKTSKAFRFKRIALLIAMTVVLIHFILTAIFIWEMLNDHETRNLMLNKDAFFLSWLALGISFMLGSIELKKSMNRQMEKENGWS